MFREKETPDEIQEAAVNAPGGRISIVQLIADAGLVPSKNEARRMIEQGAVSVGGVRISDQNAVIDISAGAVVRVGKRGFRRVRPA